MKRLYLFLASIPLSGCSGLMKEQGIEKTRSVLVSVNCKEDAKVDVKFIRDDEQLDTHHQIDLKK